MAEVKLNISTNLPQVLDEVATGNTEVAAASKAAGDAQKKSFTDTEKSAKKGIVSIAALKKEILAYEAAAIAAGEGTAEWARHIASAGKRKADLRDLKRAVDALDPDRVAAGFLGLARAGAGAFSVLESGAALAGKRNEDLQKALLKVQAAQGLLAGLQELANAKDEIGKLKIIALQKLQTLETKRGIVAIEGATVAQRVFNLVASGEGIALLAGIFAAITAAVVLYTRETKINTEAEKERSKAIDGTIIKNEELRKTYNDQVVELNKLNNEYLVLKGIITEIDALRSESDLKLKQALVDNANEAQAKIEETKGLLNIAKNFILTIGTFVTTEQARQADVAKILADKELKDSEALRIKKLDNKKIEIEAEKKATEDLKKEFDRRNQFNEIQSKREELLVRQALAQQIISAATAEDRIADIKIRSIARQLKIIEEFTKRGLDLQINQAQVEISLGDAIVDNKIRNYDELKAAGKSMSEFTIQQEEFISNETIKRNDELLKTIADFNAKRAINEEEAYAELLKKLKEFYENKKEQDDADLEKEKRDLEERVKARNIYLQSINETLGSLGDLESINTNNKIKQLNTERDQEIAAIDRQIAARRRLGQTYEDLERKRISVQDEAGKKANELAKQQFERAKGFSIAQAIVSGALAVINASATVPYIPAGLAASVAAGLATALQISKIQSTTFRKGGYTGDGSPDQLAGQTHKKEFVHTAEKTAIHRNLFEAIHKDDYSKLTAMDLAPLLQGTGVSLNMDKIIEIPVNYASRKAESNNMVNYSFEEMRRLNKQFKIFSSHYMKKPNEKILSDGTKISRKGNTTRIIKKVNA